MTKKTFADIDLRLCHLCGTCIGVCPNNMLNIENERIIFDSDKCTFCGLCYEYCPGKGVDFDRLNSHIFKDNKCDNEFGIYESCLLASSSDSKIRENGSSGGLVTGLLIYALEKRHIDGAVVVISDQKNNGKPKIYIAKNRDEIISASQSKYCLVPINMILKELEKLDGQYAIVALPCQIHALRKLQISRMKIVQNIKYIFGLFCGYNMHYAATEFVREKLKIKNEDIREIRYRDMGWPGGLTFYLNNGSKIGIDSIHYHYLNPIFLPFRCRYCSDFSAEYSDISFGDSWLKELYRKGDKNLGWSNIIIRTKKGEELLHGAIDDLYINSTEISIDDVRKSYPFNIKYKKRGIFVRLKLCKNPPKYIGLNNVNISNKEYMYHLTYYGLLIMGSNGLCKSLINYIPLNMLRTVIITLKIIMKYPSTAREKLSK